MESTRRLFNRTISTEPGLKKPRLIEEPAVQNRGSNGRGGFIQRPVASNTGGVSSEMRRDRDSGISDIQYYPTSQPQQLHQELVDQYKTALAELTFNSKPIITNLTIIAGENVIAAKAIAAIVCANILEVSSEQKLPSLYLLDSIVKNIGRDYIKHFASRLPEVFCKAYRLVDPSLHQGMRHLFGTWKGVFPSQSLQMIAEELGFTATVNGSSSGTTSYRPESKVQRPSHSIHVNPKYLEERQRLQTTTAREADSDVSGSLMNSDEGVQPLVRRASISSGPSGRSWADPYAKSIQHHHSEQVHGPVRDENSRIAAHVDSEYYSSASGRSGLGNGRLNGKFKEQGYDVPSYESVSYITGKASGQDNGFDMKPERYAALKSVNSESRLQIKQNFIRITKGMSKSWKNSEEEEFMWDEMTSKPPDLSVTDAYAKDHWAPDNYERVDFDSHIRRPRSMHELGSMELQPSKKRMLSVPDKNTSGYPTGLTNSTNPVGRTPFPSQQSPSRIGAQSLNSSVNMVQRPGPKASSTQSSVRQRSPSPSLPAQSPNHLLNNYFGRNQTSTGPPTDPRKPPGLRNTGQNYQFSQDSLPLPSQDVYQSSRQKLPPQSIGTLSALMSLQQKKYVPSTQKRKLEVPEFESSGGQCLLPSQISGSESLSTMGNSSSDNSSPLTVETPGQSSTASLLASLGISELFDRSSLMDSSTKSDFQEVGLEQTPITVHSTSNPVSSLLSSLMAKGLISGSNSDSLSSSSNQKPDQPLDKCPGVLKLIPVSSVPVTTAKPASKTVSLPSSLIQKPNQTLDRVPGVASTSSIPVSSVPITTAKPSLSIKVEPSPFKPAAKAAEDSPQSTATTKDLIGFEFKPNIIRTFHPGVVDDLLSDLPHQCSICGLKLKLQELLNRHMECHALKVPEQNPPNTTSRWYANVAEWIGGVRQLHPSRNHSNTIGEFGETMETTAQMVPADENQSACILCGELFEDFYSLERNEWMFKGAVYLYRTLGESHEMIGTDNDDASLSCIIHANCNTEGSVRDLGLSCDVKPENDA